MNSLDLEVVKSTCLDDREIKDWRNARGFVLLYSKYDTEKELRDDWADFCDMVISDQRESDWKSIDLFGVANFARYEVMLSNFLKNDIEDSLYDNFYVPVKEHGGRPIRIGFVGYSDSVFDVVKAKGIINKIFNEILKKYSGYTIEIVSGYTNMGIPKLVYQKAKSLGLFTVGIACKEADKYELFPCDKVIIKGEEWGDESETFLNYIDMMYKIGGGNQSVDEFKSMKDAGKLAKEYKLPRIQKIQESVTNGFIREEALRLYASNVDPISSAMTCIKIQESNNLVSSIIYEKTEKDIDNKVSLDNMIALSITPYYSPYELEKLGISTIDTGIYSNEPDNVVIGDITTKEWFLEYKNKFNGYNDESYTSQSTWVEAVRKLYSDYKDIKESGDITSINNRKQSILDLGWNPEIEFNESNRLYANTRVNSILQENYSNYRMIDVEQSVSLMSEEANIDYTGALTQVAVRPIFIVFFNSKSVFNKIVRVVDKSVYSHVSISFTPSLKTLYSFNAKDKGFHTEYMKDYIDSGETKAIQVFCVFVDADRYNKLKNKVSNYHKHQDHMGYSFLNLITIPLKINYINQTKMVCSQFVDSMLKLADLDITKMASSVVSPGGLNRHLKKFKGDMYKIYTGPPEKYSANKISEFINQLASSVVKTESEVLRPFLSLSYIKENKEFPVQFTDDGDLLISKGKDIDFEGEYSRCHMALIEYDKANNVEAMKYCICKLWYLNIMLEERIHEENSKGDKEKLKEYHKARAKILNDIKGYMVKVQKLDKSFDILKEYNDSPFNDKNIRIRRSTLLYSIELFKRLIGVRK